MFAFAQELYTLAEKYIQPALSERFNALLIQIIGDVAGRNYFSDEVSTEYFNILTALFQRSVSLFASKAGQEYIIVFSCSPGMVAKHDKAVKKLFLTYKQGDCVDSMKRSVFYCLMLKTLTVISQVE